MEIRKIQMTGGATLTISLPKKWINLNNLKPGDSLRLSGLRDGSLLVSTGEEKEKEDIKELEIGDESPQYLFRKLISIYMVGKGITKIYSADRLTARQRKVIREFVHKVIGTEIVEETANTVIIQDLIDTSELSITKSYRRMSLIVESMFNDAIIALRNRDRELAEDILLRDDDVDRLYWLICKQFNMLLNQPHLTAKMDILPIEALQYLSGGKNIERIADHTCRIASNVIEMKSYNKSTVDKIVKTSDIVSRMINESVKAFILKDSKAANATIENMKRVTSACAELLSEIPKGKKATVNLAYIVESMERMASYSTDIAENAINMGALPRIKVMNAKD